MGLSKDDAKIALQALHSCIYLALEIGGVIQPCW